VTIYLDYAASTPVDPRVAAAMTESLTGPGAHANAASATHASGLAARDRVEHARAQVAALIGAQPREIVFTSGATEANNLALLGVAVAATRAQGVMHDAAGMRGHFVSARAEHKSVLDPLKELARRGHDVTLLEPDEWGRVLPDAVRTALRPDTRLVSVMHANNEIGCINDIAGIAAACRERGVLLHVDASQSVGKIDADVARLGADLVSFTAHKIYGPKGIGALYVRESVRPRIAPVQFGGGHERGLRPGTLPNHQIAGFGAAAELALREGARDAAAAHALRARLAARLERIPGALLNTLPGPASLPGILNVSFAGIEGESLVAGLTPIALSTGSACSSATREPSYVLRALGRDAELAQSSLRLSFGRFSTDADIGVAADAIEREVRRLRVLAGEEVGPQMQAGPTDPDPEDSLLARTLNPLARRYFRAPPRPPLGDSLPGARRGTAGRRIDGTLVTFELEIADEIVRNARFTGYGCPHTLAVVQWLCELLEGMRPEAASPGGPADWAAKFEVPAEKLGRLLIVEDAMRAALSDQNRARN
jgi:cysteine desulfurase